MHGGPHGWAMTLKCWDLHLCCMHFMSLTVKLLEQPSIFWHVAERKSRRNVGHRSGSDAVSKNPFQIGPCFLPEVLIECEKVPGGKYKQGWRSRVLL